MNYREMSTDNNIQLTFLLVDLKMDHANWCRHRFKSLLVSLVRHQLMYVKCSSCLVNLRKGRIRFRLYNENCIGEFLEF